MSDDLRKHELLLLDFINRVGSDCPGIIDTDEKLAAAVAYDGLRRRGYLISTISDEGPVYRITRKGERAIGGKSNQ